jgi:hypothetical protein
MVALVVSWHRTLWWQSRPQLLGRLFATLLMRCRMLIVSPWTGYHPKACMRLRQNLGDEEKIGTESGSFPLSFLSVLLGAAPRVNLIYFAGLCRSVG